MESLIPSDSMILYKRGELTFDFCSIYFLQVNLLSTSGSMAKHLGLPRTVLSGEFCCGLIINILPPPHHTHQMWFEQCDFMSTLTLENYI